MTDANAPIWYLGDGQNWWGPYTWNHLQANPPPPHLTHIWAQGMPAAQSTSQYLPTAGIAPAPAFPRAPGASASAASGLYRPCPRCRATQARKVSWTWWGGLLGPALVTVVRCGKCRMSYNGRTGRSLTGFIAAYMGVSMLLGFAALVCAGLALSLSR